MGSAACRGCGPSAQFSDCRAQKAHTESSSQAELFKQEADQFRVISEQFAREKEKLEVDGDFLTKVCTRIASCAAARLSIRLVHHMVGHTTQVAEWEVQHCSAGRRSACAAW